MTTPDNTPTPLTAKALRATQGLFRAAAETNGFADHARSLEQQLTRAREDGERMREALTPFAGLGSSAGFDDTTPDETPVISGRTAIDSFMGTKRTIVSVGDIRRAIATLRPVTGTEEKP